MCIVKQKWVVWRRKLEALSLSNLRFKCWLLLADLDVPGIWLTLVIMLHMIHIADHKFTLVTHILSFAKKNLHCACIIPCAIALSHCSNSSWQVSSSLPISYPPSSLELHLQKSYPYLPEDPHSFKHLPPGMWYSGYWNSSVQSGTNQQWRINSPGFCHCWCLIWYCFILSGLFSVWRVQTAYVVLIYLGEIACFICNCLNTVATRTTLLCPFLPSLLTFLGEKFVT